MLVDTDVIIWYMRGNRKALVAIDKLADFAVSVVTYLELVQGLRNKAELNTLKRFLQSRSVSVLHISDSISAHAMFLVEQHHFGHALVLSDAFIAATAVNRGLPLLTANTKHYQMVRKHLLKKLQP